MRIELTGFELALFKRFFSCHRNACSSISGLTLNLRSWPAFVWVYVFNLGLALLFSLPLHQQIGAITAHSLASQRLTGAFDLGVMAGVIVKLSQGPGPATLSSFLSAPLYLVLYFLVVPGTLFCYQSGASAKLSTLLQSGLLHFWRFVRITLISLVVSLPILAGLKALLNLWFDHINQTIVGRPAFLLHLAGLVLIGLVAAIFRVYFDLVQVYTVQLGMMQFPAVAGKKGKPERQIRRAFEPAWRAFRRNFFRIYLTFVLLVVLGLTAVALTARAAMHSLAQPRVWPMFLLAQLGLFLMLFMRFWQRGAETILALENPIPMPVVVDSAMAAPEANSETVAPMSGDEQGIEAVPVEAVQELAEEPPSPLQEQPPSEI